MTLTRILLELRFIASFESFVCRARFRASFQSSLSELRLRASFAELRFRVSVQSSLSEQNLRASLAILRLGESGNQAGGIGPRIPGESEQGYAELSQCTAKLSKATQSEAKQSKS